MHRGYDKKIPGTVLFSLEEAWAFVFPRLVGKSRVQGLGSFTGTEDSCGVTLQSWGLFSAPTPQFPGRTPCLSREDLGKEFSPSPVKFEMAPGGL